MVVSQMQENYFECGNLITISMFAKEHMPYLFNENICLFGYEKNKKWNHKNKIGQKEKITSNDIVI
jgi:hypothetical protein